MFRTLRALALCTAAVALGGGVQAQTVIGGGKTAPTFPIQITQSGSYKLAGNLVVPAGSSGIVIANGLNVTLDLAGYQISGGLNCTKSGCDALIGTSGIQMLNDKSAVRVVNGAIRGFGYGILVSGNVAVLEDLMINGNYTGVSSAGQLTARRLQLTQNAAGGLITQRGRVSDTVAANNGGTGISITFGSVRDSQAVDNLGYGAWVGGVVEGLTTSGNTLGNAVYTPAGSLNVLN